MQSELMAQLSRELGQLIRSTIATHLQPISEQLSQRGGPSASGFPEINLDTDFVGSPGSGPGSQRSFVSDLAQRLDKVAHILNGRKIRFSGNEDGLSIDNFIYRIEALTLQTVERNFTILCSNASILFEGKARDFYWRFHKTSPVLRWDLLCQAFRKQFRNTRTDVDIGEAIRDRKQKEKKNFDSFHDTIMQMMDGLEVLLEEFTVVDILKKNLRPEIRHELLNVTIHSVDRLREICRRRFLDEVRKNQGYQKVVPFRRQVAELVEEEDLDGRVVFSDDDEVGALPLICRSCHKEGHRHQDCREKRRIFC